MGCEIWQSAHYQNRLGHSIHLVNLELCVYCRTIGADHILATAYQPQSNVMVERYHRQLKEALRAHGSGSAGLAAPQEDSGFSAAETLYEVRLLSPGQPQKKPESFAPGAPPPDTSPELYR